MRRWFITLLALLLTAQLSWAGAALCCVDELVQHQQASVAGMPDTHESAPSDAHAVCDTAGHCHCHHSGCATPLSEAQPLAMPQGLAPEPARAPRLKSFIPQGVERPNWLRA